MNYYDAQEILRRHNAGQPINYGTYEEARAYLDREPTLARRAVRPAAPPAVQAFPPTMDTPCECGLRYGQHRVGNFACPNPAWKPGNGQAQWLADVFRRAG